MLWESGPVPSYLLRVELDDRPGSLGSLAVALGSVGADIVSLDVVERGHGSAVDDLVVELPHGSMPDVLITAAERISGIRVHNVRPHTGLLDAHRELELIDKVAAADTRESKLQKLADEAPRVLRVSWCTVVHTAGADGQVRRLVGSPGSPETRFGTVPWLPITQPTALDNTAEWVPAVLRNLDVALTAAPLGDSRTAIVLGRSGGPEFLPAEVLRLGYLAGIVATLLR